MLRLLPEMLASLISVLCSNHSSALSSDFPLGRQLGNPPWEAAEEGFSVWGPHQPPATTHGLAQLEVWTSGFSLAQPWLLRALGSQPTDWQSLLPYSLSPYPCFSLSLAFKQIKNLNMGWHWWVTTWCIVVDMPMKLPDGSCSAGRTSTSCRL